VQQRLERSLNESIRSPLDLLIDPANAARRCRIRITAHGWTPAIRA